MENQLVKYRGLIYKVLKKIKLKSAEERERMYQAGLIAVWQALPKYDEGRNTKLTTFLMSCIRNKIFTELKQETRHYHKPLFDIYYYQYGAVSEYLPVLNHQEKQYLDYWLEGESVLEISRLENVSYRQAFNIKNKLMDKIKKANKDLI